ncbi:hypothetical protein [Aestuariicoccus sp. MJ-SS9]|uniref:hypothetical protein n=1 Tax=Aestuariicoccus sp. MJ-SS9 TaxID=3079855 RepID=UPI0029120187|nr:hypothetical protein [Aestuariicoccus sp. MJ-SS9]MDU8911325.1 hypothetical protein [Aestuariicoccus sp. MJ-SS9]
MSCNIDKLLDLSAKAVSPPPGSRNVRLGKVVEGPGGNWVPCATEVTSGVYYSGLFMVGSGRRQVCVTDVAMSCADMALSRAIRLASSAAA